MRYFVPGPPNKFRSFVRCRGMGTKVGPLPRPRMLDTYEGMWVAVIDGEVAAAEQTSHGLALKLFGMDHRKRARAVVQYVRPASDSYIVGVG